MLLGQAELEVVFDRIGYHYNQLVKQPPITILVLPFGIKFYGLYFE